MTLSSVKRARACFIIWCERLNRFEKTTSLSSRRVYTTALSNWQNVARQRRAHSSIFAQQLNLRATSHVNSRGAARTHTHKIRDIFSRNESYTKKCFICVCGTDGTWWCANKTPRAREANISARTSRAADFSALRKLLYWCVSMRCTTRCRWASHNRMKARSCNINELRLYIFIVAAVPPTNCVDHESASLLLLRRHAAARSTAEQIQHNPPHHHR